jgi:hypothetical protein
LAVRKDPVENKRKPRKLTLDARRLFVTAASTLSLFANNAFVLSFVYSRSMAGGPFPESLNVHKNKFIEEWNGKREITEQTFEVDQAKIPAILFTCVLFPFGIYAWTRSEFESRGDRRYKEMV